MDLSLTEWALILALPHASRTLCQLHALVSEIGETLLTYSIENTRPTVYPTIFQNLFHDFYIKRNADAYRNNKSVVNPYMGS